MSEVDFNRRVSRDLVDYMVEFAMDQNGSAPASSRTNQS